MKHLGFILPLIQEVEDRVEEWRKHRLVMRYAGISEEPKEPHDRLKRMLKRGAIILSALIIFVGVVIGYIAPEFFPALVRRFFPRLLPWGRPVFFSWDFWSPILSGVFHILGSFVTQVIGAAVLLLWVGRRLARKLRFLEHVPGVHGLINAVWWLHARAQLQVWRKMHVSIDQYLKIRDRDSQKECFDDPSISRLIATIEKIPLNSRFRLTGTAQEILRVQRVVELNRRAYQHLGALLLNTAKFERAGYPVEQQEELAQLADIAGASIKKLTDNFLPVLSVVEEFLSDAQHWGKRIQPDMRIKRQFPTAEGLYARLEQSGLQISYLGDVKGG